MRLQTLVCLSHLFNCILPDDSPVVQSPSANRGIRRPSARSFSRGPGGGSSVALSCSDVGMTLSRFNILSVLINVVVPVYDARAVSTNFSEVVVNLDELERFKRDVPVGSCVVVAYTINTWNKSAGGLKNVSFNIRWAMVLGTPDRKF